VTEGAGQDFAAQRFTTPAARLERFTEAVLEQVPRDRAVRVLDLGCGTGEQLFHLLAALPFATGVGVDLSAGSVEAAERARSTRPEGRRASFVARDYLALEEKPFDAIATYSTLYVVEGPDAALAAKLARDLVPGGVLVNCMPERSLSNTLVVLARRFFRILRGRVFEAVALFLARRLHPELTAELLRERLFYLYVIPVRYEGKAFQRALAAAGLSVVVERSEPRASLGQLRHRLVVYRKK